MTIRLATQDDVPVIFQLICDLALYEHALDEVQANEQDIADSLFGESPHVFCHVAEVDNVVVGIALWYLNFSTWLGRSGIYLEDLYVSPQFRGHGIGMEFMRELARICVLRGYRRFQWSVLDWNSPSIAFYESIGAKRHDEWRIFRLSGQDLIDFVSAKKG